MVSVVFVLFSTKGAIFCCSCYKYCISCKDLVPCETSKMLLLMKKFDVSKPLTIFLKSSILDVDVVPNVPVCGAYINENV